MWALWGRVGLGARRWDCVFCDAQIFYRDRHIVECAIGFGIIEADEDELGEDLAIDDEAIAFGCTDSGFFAGEALGKVFVGLIFVAEAAHEAAAATGDFERVEGCLLDLGAFHAHGFEHFEEVFAAAILAAALVVGGDAGFIARADLVHFDAGVIATTKATDDFAEIDAFFREVVEGDAFVAEDRLCFHDFHWKLKFFDDGLGVNPHLVFFLFECGLLFHVAGVGDAVGFAFREEWVVFAAGVLDVLEHVFAADGF